MKKQTGQIDSYEIDYRSIFDKMISSCAIHKIVLNEKGEPVDYIYIDVNPAFEKSTGLKKVDIIGKKVTEVIPGTENDPANWIGRFGKIALTGQSENFENYSEGLKKWFHIYAYSIDKGYFITIFNDISLRLKALNDLKSKNDEYEKLFNSFQNRELRMVELKSEISKLKEELKKYTP